MEILSILGRARKSPGISKNIRKLFKPVFEEFERFMKILQSLRECSEIFGKLLKRSKMVLKFSENLNFASVRKFSENFGNGSKVFVYFEIKDIR